MSGLQAAEEETCDMVARYTDGDWVVCPMMANMAVAYAA
jgi:hypothetical protein